MNASQDKDVRRSQRPRQPQQPGNIFSTETWSRIQERTARELARPRQMFLPGLDPTMRAMPNHIARSSLFAPLSKTKPRPLLNDHVLISRSDVKIRFTGVQLDESQADVWMQLMYLASFAPLGEPFKVCGKRMLEAMGRAVGGSNYRWLRRAVEALYKATLIIDVANKYCIGAGDSDSDGIRMIDRFKYDASRKQYTFAIDPRWVAMYSNQEFARIDWQKRLAIKRSQDMAKTLQRLVATSADKVQRYGLEWLKKKVHYTSALGKFQDSLSAALAELERVEIIAAAHIGTSTRGLAQVVWTKL
ncbi:plasmid replication initiator TrfA [Burkholderia multivorans]|uniref:plasmid replication initiator TrfA n=1 Tax=Burkholderia multivorans TaxID=87883 RepID=UPI001C24FD78|nr:plasmid replication initiator TrfA [Burkholderia multivorans]MBU9210720.1 plasmid-related transcriptional repressor protein [Burkholderia multivorans]